MCFCGVLDISTNVIIILTLIKGQSGRVTLKFNTTCTSRIACIYILTLEKQANVQTMDRD